MVVFDDVVPKDKLILYNHKIDWIDRVPVPRQEDAEVVEFPMLEPLQAECQHFLDCISSRKKPKTDGYNGLRVLKILEACQESLEHNGEVISLRIPRRKATLLERETADGLKINSNGAFVHKTSVVDEPCEMGEGTKIWHFSHIMKGARIGKNCRIGQNVVIAGTAILGNNVKVQNNVSVYDGVILEDDVFCGPSAVFTNIINPRSAYPRNTPEYFLKTLVKQGATIGANATILCAHTIGRHAFIGAGSVVTRDVPDYALIYGNPARINGWMCECGSKLNFNEDRAECQECGKQYQKGGEQVRRLH